MKQAAHVASPPARPLMVYDGECNFCKFWIIRWQRATEGWVDYGASQSLEVTERFPEIPREQFEKAVQFIETDGTVYCGAEAVFRSLIYSRYWKWLLWVYYNVPGMTPLTERAYYFVAKRRETFSFLTRILWGREGAAPTYDLVRSVFLRFLAIIYFIAFVSLGSQVMGLIGSNGIVPARDLMEAVKSQADQQQIGLARYHMMPTLCWFDASDGFLRFLCWAGAGLAVLLFFGIAPAPCLFLLWLIYLSLAQVGGEFLLFQWDALLLEAGWLAIFLAPLQLWPRRATTPRPSRLVLWLFWWLVFRLMFESGMVKLASGDPTWRGLTALQFHYETQPLPTWIGWYLHQIPSGFHTVCVALLFVIELVMPFLIFAPRRLRFVACAAFLFLQTFILLTGNYTFFNLLTIALCLLLLDDALVKQSVPARWRKRFWPAQEVSEQERGLETKALGEITVPSAPMVASGAGKMRWPLAVTVPLTLVILMVTVPQVLISTRVLESWPQPSEIAYRLIGPFQSANNYGLFAVMTTNRFEIVVQGSDDGQIWKDYEFRYKPGDLKRKPEFVAPHQPRLDWQMWFAALRTYQENRWFVNFCVRLLQGQPEVLRLLESNPFPAKPPKYIRAVVYEYHFTNFGERRATGDWWRREYRGVYLPQIALP